MATNNLGNLEEDFGAASKGAKKTAVAQGLPETVRVILNEDDAIPPTGLFVGFNGRGYLIQPNQEVDLPLGVLEILDNAIHSVPKIDPLSRRVVDYASRPRFTYQTVRGGGKRAA